jgi:peptidoglycan/xylan/chitin deacetylase (PgdA/CDA1 family)
MSEFWIGIVFVIFALILLLGFFAYFRKTSKKWIYFSLSLVSFLTGISLIAISDWSYTNFGPVEKADTTILEKNKIETPKPKEKSDSTDPNKGSTEENKTEKEEPTIEEKNEQPVVPSQPTQTKPEPKTPEPSTTPSAPIQKAPEKIAIPDNGSVNYTVIKGDTLWSISTRTNVTVSKIKYWNHLTSDLIYVGQALTLYGKNNEPAIIQNPIAPTNPAPNTPVNAAPSKLITQGNLQQKEIAFTFDAGSDIAGIQILEILKKYNVKATFFLTGKWAEKFPDYAKQIVNAGHEIGNHSYSHQDAIKISSSSLIQEINQADQIIKTVTGRSPKPYFRFPYGSYNQSVLNTVGQAGYPYSIQWSLDTIDWQQPSADVIVSRIESGASNGDIVLMHIGGIHTPEAVDRVIPILRKKGYKLVTLSQILQ